MLDRLSLLCVLVLSACTPATPSATDLLPTVPTANIVQDQTLAQYQRSLQTGIIGLREHPAEAQLLTLIDDAHACYKAIAGTSVRIYADKRLPLMSGFIAIANRHDQIDPTPFSSCLAQGTQSPALQPTFALCSYSYTLTRGDTQYDVAYLALSQAMCTAFCARLPGCTAQQ